MRLPRLALLLALLPLLCLTACGGGDGDDTSGAPDVPADVFANPAPDGAFVGWRASDEPDLQGYRIVATAAGQPTVTADVAAPATGVRLAGLTAGQTYSVSVLAEDTDANTSAASAAASVRVPRENTATELLAFNNAAAYSASQAGEALLIYRDGQLVFERYQNQYDGSAAHVLASGTKSFSCAFLLAATEDGYVSPSMRVAEVLTEWAGDTNKSQMTVHQLLSLQGGLSTNPDYSPLDVPNLDTYQLALDDPANYAPGEAFIYDPLAFQAFALLFERRAGGRDPVAYLREKVFVPIGLGGDLWQRDAENKPQMAGGASMTAQAWARYGQLMLQNGTWESTRVLPADGVRDCLTYQNPAYLGYGVTWWLNRPVGDSYDPNVDQIPEDGIAGESGQIAPSQPADVVMAAGTGHQRLYLLPSQGLVVVRFATLESQFDNWSDDAFLSRLTAF